MALLWPRRGRRAAPLPLLLLWAVVVAVLLGDASCQPKQRRLGAQVQRRRSLAFAVDGSGDAAARGARPLGQGGDGEEVSEEGGGEVERHVFHTPIEPLVPPIEAESCLRGLIRSHSPYPRSFTRKFLPRAFNLMDREYFYKPPAIPDNFKTPCFTKCAIVGSSGVMKKSQWGRVIDAYPAVIRLNNAPTYKHESDVGRRTTIRIMHDMHIAERNLAELLRLDPGGVALVWPPTNKPKGLAGPPPKPERTRFLAKWLEYSNSSSMLTRFSRAGFYDSHMMARKLVAPYPPHVPSTGWMAMYAALHLCQETHVYGLAWALSPETYERAGHKRVGKAYYWYKHEKGNVNENDYYYKREIKYKNSKHGFAEEKDGYRKLAQVYNIHFH